MVRDTCVAEVCSQGHDIRCSWGGKKGPAKVLFLSLRDGIEVTYCDQSKSVFAHPEKRWK